MFQPSATEGHPSLESDPLLDFFSEQASAPQPAVPAGMPFPEKPQQSAQPVEPVERVEPAAPRDDLTTDLLQRLERVERLLDRSVMEIAALRSDLATLVTTVEDIKKRQGRREIPLPAPAQPASRIAAVPAMIAVGVLAAFATGVWGLMTFAAAYAAPEPPAIQAQPAEPASVPPPVVGAAVLPEVEPQKVESVSAGAPARAAPRVDPPARAAPRVVNYVGTLTIDANPPGEVFLNRKPVGPTPLRLDGLRAGSHLIWIEREGFRRWTRVVPVAADRISRVSATLDPVDR